MVITIHCIYYNLSLPFYFYIIDHPCTPLLDQLNVVASERRSTPLHSRGPTAGQEPSTSQERSAAVNVVPSTGQGGWTTVHVGPATVQVASTSPQEGASSSTHGNYNTLYY